jgi:hypothetical protein
VAAELTRAVTVHLHLTNLADGRRRSRRLRALDPEFSGGLDTRGRVADIQCDRRHRRGAA